MTIRNTLLAAAASLFLATGAYAAPITGQISLNGYAEAVGSAGMGSATGIDFANGMGTAVTGTSGTLSSFGAGSGAFAALGTCNTGACGTIKDIASFAANTPIQSFLTLATSPGVSVTFDLTSITNLAHNTTDDSISFTATGIINFTGYDPTAGKFFLTAQGDNITSFSATTLSAGVSPVPEPASLALLGGTLTALGLVRRKKA